MSAGKAPDGLRQSFLSGLSSVLGDMNEGRSINYAALLGAAPVGPAQVGQAQVGQAQVGPAQVGPAQVAQVGQAQVGPARVDAAQQPQQKQSHYFQYNTQQSHYFQYNTPQMLQAYLNSQKLDEPLYLNFQLDVLFENTRFDGSLFRDIIFPQVKYLGINSSKRLTTLRYFNFPDSLTELVVYYTGINSLAGVKFPPNLIRLRLDHNQIDSLDGAEFPISLQNLDLTNNKIKSLNGVAFPPNLTYLGLSNNNITSLLGARFPPNLIKLSLGGNPISSLKGIIDPSPNVTTLLGNTLPMQVNYFREKSALKDAKQSEQATLKQISDFNQQSTQNQLRGITSFLREGMEARAQQHAEQLEREGEERGKLMIYIRLTANRMRYPVPLNATETVQSVLDYINEHYYVSSLVSNCGAIYLYKSSDKKDLLLLTTTRTLADYNVVNGDTLIAECHNIQMNGGGINQTNKKYTIKTRKIKNKNKKSKKRWSLKYKKSIDCKRPRGFSQRQYCNYGRKKS